MVDSPTGGSAPRRKTKNTKLIPLQGTELLELQIKFSFTLYRSELNLTNCLVFISELSEIPSPPSLYGQTASKQIQVRTIIPYVSNITSDIYVNEASEGCL